MVDPNLDRSSEQAACYSSRFDYDEPNAAGNESTTELLSPREYWSNYFTEEEIQNLAQHHRLIPETILKIVNQNRVKLMTHMHISAELLSHLQSRNVFTTEQIECIKIKNELNTEQADMVLDMLPRLSFFGYVMFRDCLIATNQQHVCHYLPLHDESDILRKSRNTDDRFNSDRRNEGSESTTVLPLPREFRSNYTTEEESRIRAQLNRPIPGSESTTVLPLPREFRSNYTTEEESRIRAQLKRPIPAPQVKIMDKNRVKLAEDIDISTELVNHLQARNVFTTGQLDKIKVHQGSMLEKASMVLDMLRKKSIHRYLLFLDCLKATQQDHLCVYLPTHDDCSSA